MQQQSEVVVGVDGSSESIAAVEWAALDAARRQRGLHLIHAYAWPVVHPPLGAQPTAALRKAVRKAADRILRAAVARAAAVAAGVPVTTATALEPAATALVKASQRADVVVVGSRGLGGFSGLLLGSVGVQLAAHAACPVVVIRSAAGDDDAGPEAGHVIVGVDGSHNADRAMRFALEQASFRGAGLTAVHTYVWPDTTGPGDMLPLVYDRADLRDDERRALAESVAGWADKFPDVEVRQSTVRGGAAAVLTRLSRGAELMVVGSRGRGGFTGLLLGSVSQALIHHAGCPVAVVR
ncbi:universal stress protein [Dactylosporangium aurantiacum]|uniref:Universal stress protein n=1 Tax=Dactylosporangium aurantiacum TaxID=35754 RepID=A0A9Q9IR83_9ACTN|nr:universal stress protein [Dactylosporangium aurantiacum]MDG6105929.1 universal stress protein [Dactylosporangium aurantiacum]UWZ57900.1 universal stress protein [Dactylosporangium aurantiacum]